MLFLCVFTVHLILRLFEPQPYVASLPPTYEYDMNAMLDAVDWREVKAEQERLLAFGSRFMGQPGFYDTENYIRNVYAAAGLEVLEQENWTVVPKTETREIFLVESDGQHLLDDVALFPFMPNHLQPMNTPEDGLTGELVVLTTATLATRPRFDDCIGLVNAAEGQHVQDTPYDWARYAGMGMKAFIVAHPAGLEKIDWNAVSQGRGAMVASIPVNFVRLAATPEIFQYAGRQINLRVRTKFENTRNTTLIGILRSQNNGDANSSEDALILLTNYDAASILPDLAPGTAQAIPVAYQLALLKGLAQYRKSMVRDVIFVAFGAQVMARDGDNNLLKILNENLQNSRRDPLDQILSLGGSESSQSGEISKEAQARIRRLPWEERYQDNEEALRQIEAILKQFDDPKFLADPAATQAAVATLDETSSALFDEQIGYVLDALTFELYEPQFQAKLAFLQSTDQSLDGPGFKEYQRLKREYDSAVALSNFSLFNLLTSTGAAAESMAQYDLRARWHDRFIELHDHHLRLQTHLAQNLAILDALASYRKMLVFDNRMVPAPSPTAGRKELLSFFDGAWGINAHIREMASLFSSARQRVALHRPDLVAPAGFDIPMLNQWHSGDVDRMTKPLSQMSTVEWTVFGYHMCSLMNFDRVESYQRLYTPVDLPFMRDTESLRSSFAVTAEMLLSVSHGNGRFAPIQLGWLKKHFGGRVYASGVGQTLMPRFPLKGAFLASRSFFGQEYSYPGFYEHPIITTDPYGRYELFNTPSDFWVNHYIWKYGYSPIAALHGRDGLIHWMKDEGETGQRLYKSVNINWFDAKVDRINIVLFRASPLAMLDLTNPQKMTDFSGARLLDRDGLSEITKYCHFRVTPIDGPWVSFVEPDRPVYVALESGSPENDLAKVIRGFMLGPIDGGAKRPGSSIESMIDGAGFLPAATDIIDNVPHRMAESMNAVNQSRLSMQVRHGMADEQVIDYGQKAQRLLDESRKPDPAYAQTVLAARDSETYSMLVHPVLRQNIVEAVLGIIYYLALLVPFVFFFEKMLFCHTDIRRQLAVQAVTFLIVFILLRLLHPAFGLLRSSLMILLGFIIILISSSMTVFFSSKFKQNIDDLKKHRGHVAGADVNRLGVIITSFLLGLNNMHRRKVRTFLTCGTLTLLTFAMLGFTSTHTKIINEETAVGKAPWHGVLVKRENFKRLTAAEVSATRAKYEHKFEVCPRMMSLGTRNWLDKQGYNPELEIIFGTDDNPRSMRFDSIIRLTHNEPLRHQIEMLTATPWFAKSDETASTEKLCPVMLPDDMAGMLGIRAADVEKGEVQVRINGRAFHVLGIFSSQSLADARDLDGRDILPYNIKSMAQVHVLEDGEVVADDNAPRLNPGKIILTPFRPDLGIQIPNEKPDSYVSLALSMPAGNYRAIRGEIDTYLEQSERTAYFGIDGNAYRGRRTRKASLSGLAELTIPLLIAALTVLNTMKGSVYERRGEILIYNAIGIAPRYVFFIFMAEAFVYAVVGTMLGYLLSQSTGSLLTALNLTGGLNMSFTSITTIYASLAVAATVFISTIFPARTAMGIAKPTDDAGWALPEPKDNILEIELPFMFNAHDRTAVLAFCHRYLEDHGEGGTGAFFSSHPTAEVIIAADDIIPAIAATTWLKPYDLGVSQAIAIRMEPAAGTAEFKAWLRIERLTGSREAWLRLNHAFVSDIRRHLLYWRAFPEKDRHNLRDEARAIFLAAAKA